VLLQTAMMMMMMMMIKMILAEWTKLGAIMVDKISNLEL
jgi:hypothetical protein